MPVCKNVLIKKIKATERIHLLVLCMSLYVRVLMTETFLKSNDDIGTTYEEEL